MFKIIHKHNKTTENVKVTSNDLFNYNIINNNGIITKF